MLLLSLAEKPSDRIERCPSCRRSEIKTFSVNAGAASVRFISCEEFNSADVDDIDGLQAVSFRSGDVDWDHTGSRGLLLIVTLGEASGSGLVYDV
jgi:hypothetical protein